VLRAERWTQSSEITTKRDLREQGVHGLQETPRSLLSVTLWEDTLRYVNRRSLAHDEAERWFRKRTEHAKTLLPRRGNDRTHFTVWRLTWPDIKAFSPQSRWRSWRQKWKIISIFFSYMRNSALIFRTFFTDVIFLTATLREETECRYKSYKILPNSDLVSTLLLLSNLY